MKKLILVVLGTVGGMLILASSPILIALKALGGPQGVVDMNSQSNIYHGDATAAWAMFGALGLLLCFSQLRSRLRRAGAGPAKTLRLFSAWNTLEFDLLPYNRAARLGTKRVAAGPMASKA